MPTWHLIPHTHWDREWYLSRAAFDARLGSVMDDVVDRLEREPAVRSFHLDGQTVLLEDYLALRPGREARVRRLVEAGRLVTGPWYVLADEQIPSGEGLLRNLLLGQRDLRFWGAEAPVCYSPDAFGHPAALPQLAGECAIRWAVLWRGHAGDRDLFRWRAADGHELLVYHLPPQGYEIGGALPSDVGMLAGAWPAVREALLARAATGHVAVFVGADHHALHPDLAGLAVALNALEPESDVRISSLDEFFREVEGEVRDLPVVTGELRRGGNRTWVLQGQHGTRAPLKRRYARLELALTRWVEPLAALARAAGGAQRRHLLDAAWRHVVQAQFHDTLCGTCADPVADAMTLRLGEGEAYAHEVMRGAVHDLAGHDPDRARVRPDVVEPSLLLWNPAARPREGDVVTAALTFLRAIVPVGPPGGPSPRTGPGYRPFALRTSGGEDIPVQVLRVEEGLERLDAARHYPMQRMVDRVWVAFRAPALDGLASRLAQPVEPGATANGEVEAGGDWLANALVRLHVERDGTLSLEDRTTGETYTGLCDLAVEPDAGDTYSFCPADEQPEVRREPVTTRRIAEGPLVGALELQRALHLTGHGVVGVRIVLSLRAGSRAVGVRIELENHAVHHRLRLAVPVGVGGDAVAGAAFGVERRGPGAIEPSTALETAVATAPAHRYVSAARGARGLAIFAPGFFEYEWTFGGTLLVTLVRAVGELSRNDLPTRPGHAGWPTPAPGAQCLGPDRMEFTLAPVDQDDLTLPERLEGLWEDAHLPIATRWLADCTAEAETPRPLEGLSLALEGDGLVFSTCKPAERGERVIVRCWNTRESEVDGVLRLGGLLADRTAMRVRGNEADGVEIPVESGVVRFTAGPREIVTIRLS